MGKIEIVRDYKLLKSGLKDTGTGEMVIPCEYHINSFTMVTDVDKLIDGIYVLKNKNFNYEMVLGIYFKKNNYLYSLPDCQITLYHYSDFNALFTHDYNNHEYKSAILFDNEGKFITEARIHQITEYDKKMIDELGILTDSDRVYLVNGEFYEYTKAKYPLVNRARFNTYPFTRLKDRVMSKVETDYGEKAIDADSIAELDYKQELYADIMEETYNNSLYLQEKYPKVKCKKM